MKKIYTLFFSLVASVGTIFAYKVQIGDLYYNLDDANKTAEVTYKDGLGPYENGYPEITNLSIPSSVVYNETTYKVTKIGYKAFYRCYTLLTVIIPNSVTSIEDYAFYFCYGLTSVTIGNSVTSIGDYAFCDCYALTSATIGNNVESIGSWAFENCTSLTSIVIPNSVTSIGKSAFYHCYSLPIIDNIRYADTYLVEAVDKSLSSSYTIKEGTKWIGDFAFEDCSALTSVTIPNSVTSIGDYAFNLCDRLTYVKFESTIPPTLGSYAFNGFIYPIYVPCGSLEAYQNAEGWSEYYSRIKYAPNPYTITKIAENGYINTTGTDMYTICDEPLVTCTARPNSGYQFVSWADGNTDNPRTIELSQDTTMEAIFDYLLTGKCGKDNALSWTLDTTTWALNITGKGALSENYTYGTFIESLTIGNEITQIGEIAFYSFEHLKNIILGSSVKVLESEAFRKCSSIESITCYSQRPPTVNDRALEGLDYSTIVYVPADYLNTYKMHDAWGLYDVRPIGAATTETTDVKVTPEETTATVVWPSVSGAASYELVIKDKDGNIICTLVFNAQGQLTSIAFAPSRNNAPQQTQTAGFSFTVTGLEEGTGYDLTISSKNESGVVLDEKTVSFYTNGGNAIEDIYTESIPSTKVLHNGQVVIQRGEKVYTLTGQEVK